MEKRAHKLKKSKIFFLQDFKISLNQLVILVSELSFRMKFCEALWNEESFADKSFLNFSILFRRINTK
jgi:hypothetical protein